MNQVWGMQGARVFRMMVMVGLGGCGDEEEPPPVVATCADADKIAGVCVGVPPGNVCDSDPCTKDVTCAEVIPIGNDAELHQKAQAAVAGACLSLAPGQYTAVSLPGGVSLLGRSAAAVKIDAIVLGAGAGAVVRGLAVGPGGVELQGATSVRIESVRVTGDPAVTRDGVTLNAGASATIVTSTLDGAGRVGVFAADADVTLDRCIVSGAHAAGIWVEGSGCDASCACSQRPTLTITKSLIRSNHLTGLSTSGATASLVDTSVLDTLPGDTLSTGMQGGGMAVSECSDVSATKLRVVDSADYGVRIDRSLARLGDDKDPDGTVEISRNLRGLWIQNVLDNSGCATVGGCVTLHNGALEGNLGVGIGVAGSSQGVILCKSTVKGTASTTLPVSDVNKFSAVKPVGDGVNWLDTSQVTIEALTLSDNARQSLLIDGPASGNIMSLILTGSDANKAPLQQDFMMGDAQPTLGNGVTLMSQDSRKFAVPELLAAPPPP